MLEGKTEDEKEIYQTVEHFNNHFSTEICKASKSTCLLLNKRDAK